ncbi:MAG: PQQ-binding-like beta-propeller repeat protein [Pirellulales bacterium]
MLPIVWLLAAFVAHVPFAVRAEDWPQFRGMNASGLSLESSNLPTEFSTEQNCRWSVELKEGIASPIISAGRVFATEMSGPGTFAVLAFDAAEGKPLWRQEFETGPLPTLMPPNVPASSTPASDGTKVYVHFCTLGMLALDAATGEVVWKRPLPEAFYLMAWGDANSPIVYDDLVIYNQDDDLAPFLIALDKQTGEVRWRTPRPDMLAGYSVPVLCTAGGRTDVVIAGTGKLKGYDPATGKERWTCNTLVRTMMTSPVVHDDTIYVSVQSYGDSSRLLKFALLEWKDTNQDAKLAKSEVPEAFWKKFDAGDTDGDGFLVDKEIDTAFQSPDNLVGGGSIVQAIRGGGEGNVTKTHVRWSLENKASSNIASPLWTNGRLFVVKQSGLSSCFDAETGTAHWMLKRIDNLGNYYGSPVAADGKIFVPGENGFVVVLKDGPKKEVLAINDLADPLIATPAIADGRLYFRTSRRLLCIGN